jgi:hypothetical protein
MAEQPATSLRDWGISLIRTGVPIAWGNLLVFLGAKIPALEGFLHDPQVIGGGTLLTSAVALGWYAVMRKLEPHLPPWLTVLVLGANAAPVYDVRPPPMRFPLDEEDYPPAGRPL